MGMRDEFVRIAVWGEISEAPAVTTCHESTANRIITFTNELMWARPGDIVDRIRVTVVSVDGPELDAEASAEA